MSTQNSEELMKAITQPSSPVDWLKVAEELEENEHIDLLMIGDVLVHEPVYKSGIQSDGTLNYDHFFYNIQSDLDEAEIKSEMASKISCFCCIRTSIKSCPARAP